MAHTGTFDEWPGAVGRRCGGREEYPGLLMTGKSRSVNA
jgi:hypothetical protein